ncbi:hypothetical protein [Fluviicola taffensis]|uniref:hypothetical protein n=1 Tax=Fluviicola taffensis TaxID=191579 RepID=UPI003137CD91
MKTFLTTLLVTFCCLTLTGQSLIEDAFTLKKLIDPKTGQFYKGDSTKKIVLPLLNKKYFNEEPDSLLTSYTQLFDLTAKGGIEENPFLHEQTPYVAGPVSKSKFDEFLSNGLSSIGGADVTQFANALASFMVKRAKEELTMTFFDKFKEDLEKKEFSELKILFPATYKTLKAFDENTTQYNAYLQVLREAFEKDLSQMTEHIPKVWQQEKYRAFFADHPEILEILNLAGELSAVLANGKHPGNAIHSLAVKSLAEDTDTTISNIKNTVRFLDLILQSFRTSKSGGKYWVSADTLEMLATDPILRKIYLGLLVQKEKGEEYKIVFKTKDGSSVLRERLIDSVAIANKDVDQLVDYFQSLAPKIDDVERDLKLVRENKGADNQHLYDLFNSFINLTEASFEIENVNLITKSIPNFKVPEYFKSGIYISRLSNETYIDIAKKNYGSAIINVSLLVDTVLGIIDSQKSLNRLKDSIMLYAGTWKSLDSLVVKGKEKEIFRLIKSALAQDKNILDDFDKLKNFIKDSTLKANLSSYIVASLADKNQSEAMQKVLRYGTLAANLVGAKTEEEAEAAIEAIALPAGSARIKKEMKESISLNSYLGGFYGSNDGFKHDNSYGVTGLVGVGYNWGGCRKKPKNPGSYSIFVSVIDVGALATFRTQSDTSDYKLKVKLNQIVSPGVFFIYGFPGAPISFIAGYQYAPFISSVNSDNYTIKSNPGRITVGITVDIPLMSFYNKSR